MFNIINSQVQALPLRVRQPLASVHDGLQAVAVIWTVFLKFQEQLKDSIESSK